MVDSIGEGRVWIGNAGLPERCIVKITNRENGRSVLCEALQFDKNHLGQYSESPHISIESPTSAIVVGYWYRARSGGLQGL